MLSNQWLLISVKYCDCPVLVLIVKYCELSGNIDLFYSTKRLLMRNVVIPDKALLKDGVLPPQRGVSPRPLVSYRPRPPGNIHAIPGGVPLPPGTPASASRQFGRLHEGQRPVAYGYSQRIQRVCFGRWD